jgi:hypothetical protein
MDERDRAGPPSDPQPPAIRSRSPGREPIYRLVLALMTADIVVGLGLAGFGGFVLQDRAVTLLGIGLAVLGTLLLVFFRRLGSRAMRR